MGPKLEVTPTKDTVHPEILTKFIQTQFMYCYGHVVILKLISQHLCNAIQDLKAKWHNACWHLLAQPFFRNVSGIFCVQILEEFAVDFPG